jgi:hypothetical protein
MAQNTVDIFRSFYIKERQQAEEIETLKKQLEKLTVEAKSVQEALLVKQSDHNVCKQQLSYHRNREISFASNAGAFKNECLAIQQKLDESLAENNKLKQQAADHETLQTKYSQLQKLIAELHALSVVEPQSTVPKDELCKGCKKCNPNNVPIESNAANCLMCGHVYQLHSTMIYGSIKAQCGCIGVGHCCAQWTKAGYNSTNTREIIRKCDKDPKKHDCFKCRNK